MTPHFIYCYGENYNYMANLEILILSKMKEYGLQSTIFTGLDMDRRNLITKETSKKAYEGKLKNEFDWRLYEGSINDDLESFFNHLQEISSLEEIKKGRVWSFFLPKLTDKELELIEKKDSEHMMTYRMNWNPDVNQEEMKKSDSQDKYLLGTCFRVTNVLPNEVNQTPKLVKDLPTIFPRQKVSFPRAVQSVTNVIQRQFSDNSSVALTTPVGALQTLANTRSTNELLSLSSMSQQLQMQGLNHT